MAKDKKTSKKEVRQELARQLEKNFAMLEQTLGKTKFRRNIKKASKALSEDVKGLPAKKIKEPNGSEPAPATMAGESV